MIIEPYEQKTDEWFAAKAGVASSSNFGKILSPTGKLSTSAKEYAHTLAIERLNGPDPDPVVTWDMKRGTLLEPEARALLCILTGIKFKEVGFIYADDRKNSGCSPDGIELKLRIGAEIKSFKRKNHIDCLEKNEMPTKHVPQVQGSMSVTGFDSWLFMSYYPGLKPLILTIPRDEEYIKKQREAIDSFNIDLDLETERLRGIIL